MKEQPPGMSESVAGVVAPVELVGMPPQRFLSAVAANEECFLAAPRVAWA